MQCQRLLFALVLCVFAGRARAQETAPFARAGAHVATEECARCHEGQHRKLARSPHGAILQAATLPGCETCHGPGAEHAADEGGDLARITMPQKLAATAQVQLCGSCHQDQIDNHGGDPRGFAQAGKTCTDCHEVHVAAGAARPAGPDLRARSEAMAAAAAVGSAACRECHPIRDELLADSVHQRLASHARDDGCELCHGNGALHVRSSGVARQITRPDRAADGVATCRQCHEQVDARAFHWRGRRAPYLAAGLTCASCHRIHVARAPKAAAERPPDRAAQPAAPRAVATNRLCAQCHVPALCTMPGSTHRSLGAPDAPLARGCGACHAGGEAHAASGGRRALVERLGGSGAAAQARVCLACHREDAALRHVRQGAHERADVGCVDCHGPLHGADPARVAASAEAQCARCHGAVVAEFALPNHHPVPEGRVRCASCHDVHGARARVRDLQLAERSCVECHPRYGGPFVYAHQASRRDGCVVCHTPHGSPNRRLLRQADSRQNCLSCHGDFPVFHDQTTGAVFTDCLRCHTEVHGSNHSRFLFR